MEEDAADESTELVETNNSINRFITIADNINPPSKRNNNTTITLYYLAYFRAYRNKKFNKPL